MNKYAILLFNVVILSMVIACSGENHELDSNEGNGMVSDTTATPEPIDTTINTINTNSMNIKIGETILSATLVENSSTEALKNALAKAPITIDMRDYGNMEKVGSFGRDFPTNDEPITTEAGDLILYQGSAFVIYYAPNSWTFTRLGKIDNITQEKLKDVLGNGDVSVTLSLPEN